MIRSVTDVQEMRLTSLVSISLSERSSITFLSIIRRETENCYDGEPVLKCKSYRTEHVHKVWWASRSNRDVSLVKANTSNSRGRLSFIRRLGKKRDDRYDPRLAFCVVDFFSNRSETLKSTQTILAFLVHSSWLLSSCMLIRRDVHRHAKSSSLSIK